MRRRRISERLVASLLLAAVRLTSSFPLSAQRWLGQALGRVFWKLDTRSARVTRRNIALCFPGMKAGEREVLVCESLQQTAMILTEAGAMFHWSAARWQRLAIRVTGVDRIVAAQAAGRGVLILVPHLGNWEYLSLFLGSFGVTAVYDPPRIPALEAPIRAARSRSGATLLPIDRSGLRAVYEALGRGGVVALLPDQVPDRTAGQYADFFGHPALTMTFAHRLVRRTKPTVLFGTALRVPRGFHVRFVEADATIHEPDAVASLAAMNRDIETLVAAAPTQYQWEYKRFKRPPAGNPDPYAPDSD